MTDRKISALPAAAVLDGDEVVPVVQDGATVKTTATALAAPGNVRLTGNQSVAGVKTFANAPVLPAGALPIAATSGLQVALDAKAADADVVHDTGPESIAGVKTFLSAPVVPDASFAIAKTNGLQTALDGKAALTASQTFTGTQSLRAATAGAAQMNLLDSTGAAVAQVRGLAGANFGMGANVLDSITTGSYNVAVGSDALSSDTSGYLNTAIGLNALGAMTEGFQNTAIGANALQHADGVPGALPGTNGTNNTAIGANAAQQITTGHRNVAVGVDALFVETTGIHNTGVGVHALNSQVGVDGGTAVGYGALFSNVSGANNTAVGDQALYSATAGNNTAVGRLVANALTTGADNTAVGALALSQPNANFANRTITGSYQTAVGSQTGQSSAVAADYGTALGYVALFAGTGATALGAYSNASHNLAVALGFGSVTNAVSQVQIKDRHVEMAEITDPAAGAADTARLYSRDNGSGKTQLCVRFASGAVQVLATEP